DENGQTALMFAAANSDLDVSALQALVAAGGDIHARTADKQTVMTHAAAILDARPQAICRAQAKLQYLIGAGANINENLAYTPVMLALYVRNFGMAKLIHA